ncbi:MAG: hypothetical protein QG604_632 [Candidatus Dependentiae bacterium]|nr:hypothetical protein [Candidatus Dependentiae bacterium]
MLRKSRLTITFFLVISTLTCITQAGTPIIAGYLFPAPHEVLESMTIEEIKQPVVGGVKMTYSGYTDYTNSDGYFSFPKHHTEPELRIIVCPETDYDLTKNTVSSIKTKSATPAFVWYLVTKQQDNGAAPVVTKDPNATPAQPNSNDPKPANETPGNSADKNTAKSADDTQTKNLAAAFADPNATPTNSWYFKVEAKGSTLPPNGIKPTDLVIHCDPSAIYLQDQSVYYSEESSHFIIPDECIYLLKTPPAPALDQNDLMTESVDAETEKDTVDSKSTETDSMGNALPGVVRSAILVS